MSDVVIKAEHLSKYYNLGVINNGTLFRDIQTWWALKRGKEDPHSQIGSHKYDTTKDGFWALKDLNFEIKQGDRVGIIGKNGAGKSTLLKILSRITAPTEGKVKIKGRVASLLEVGTGFHAELTGRENIYLNGAILGMKRREVDRKIDEIIAFSEIENHIDTPVKRYSSGMYVRLAFAVAAHLDSEILIADEVLAVGDAAFQKKALGKMNDLSTGEGRTVLFVSHNMGQVKNLCTTGIVLEKGHILTYSSLKDAVSIYLNSSVDNYENSYKSFALDERKDFQVEYVSITDNKNKNLKEFESQTPIRINIHCISRKPIPQLQGYFSILTSDNIPFITFDSTECKKNQFDKLSKGNWKFSFDISPGILAPGIYTLYCNFTSNYQNSFNIDSPMECCKFTVKDTISRRGDNRGSILSYIPEIIKTRI